MPALLHPGVYVSEVPSGVRTIEGVPTSTTIFVGETERGPVEPTKIKGISDYERLFGGYLRSTTATPTRVTMRYEIDAYFGNGGTTAYVLRAVTGATTGHRDITIGLQTAIIRASSPGAWAANLRVVTLAPSNGVNGRFRLAVFYRDLVKQQFSLVEDWDRLTVAPADAQDDNYAPEILKRSNFIQWDPASTATTGPTSFDFNLSANGLQSPKEMTDAQVAGIANVALATGASGGDTPFVPANLPLAMRALDGIDDAAVLVSAPDAWLAPGVVNAKAYYDAFRQYVDNRPKQDLFYVADLPRQQNTAVTNAVSNTATFVNGPPTPLQRSTMVGAYWPHVVALDPVGTGRDPIVTLPASGFVAGIFARTDGRRGVAKAPAGVEAVLNGIVRLEHDMLDVHQDDLNPLGVNALRQIPAAGAVVWGSRTLRPDSEYRYVPVRRTAMFLRKSIYNGIQWAVFEPNDETLWQSLRATIGAFMETQFRTGLFAGRTSREAYFVKCDAETTTANDQAAGVVNIKVGFAPLRPAEFVVVELTQMTRTEA